MTAREGETGGESGREEGREGERAQNILQFWKEGERSRICQNKTVRADSSKEF